MKPSIGWLVALAVVRTDDWSSLSVQRAMFVLHDSCPFLLFLSRAFAGMSARAIVKY